MAGGRSRQTYLLIINTRSAEMDDLQENGQGKRASFCNGRLHSGFSRLQRASTGFITILGF